MTRDRPDFRDLFDGSCTRVRSVERPNEHGGQAVTVCVAALFSWNYALPGDPPQFKWAAITASDQMITAGDIQYEPRQQKVAMFTQRALLLVAGDFATHSEAIDITSKQIKGRAEETPFNIALIYGQAIQRIKRRNAEDRILAPLGLNTDTFLSQQKEMSDYFANDLKDQLQRFHGQDVEAIVVGSDGDYAHIYEIDSHGSVSCMDDVAFHAIGAGAWHAKSQLMQAGYARTSVFADALAQVYAAKRRAEVAPGVGLRTDFHIILKDGWIRLENDIQDKLDDLYREYTTAQAKLAAESVNQLRDYLDARSKKIPSGDEGSEADNGQAGELAAQAPQGDDGEEEAPAPSIPDQEKGAA